MTDRPVMYPARFTIFLTVLCAAPVVDRLAGLTEYVTYIGVIYRVLSLVTSLVVCVGFPRIIALSSRALLVPTIYVIGFFISSIYGVNPEYSMEYRLMLLPFVVVDFFQWFLAGLLFNEKSFQKKIYFYAAIYGLLSIIFSLFELIDVDMTRVIAGPDIPIALVASIVSYQGLYSLFLTIVAIGSLKKTVVLCSIGGGFIALFLMRLGGVSKGGVNNQFKYSAFLQFAAFAGCVVPFLFVAMPYIDQTILRLFVEREDVLRDAMFDEFSYLLPMYFPWGSGYYTFGFMTQYTLDYMTVTADGREMLGMSLHNTFMHVLLEGGVVVTACFAILYATAIIYGIRLYRNIETRTVAILMLSWVLVSLMYGVTNQLHATRYYFGILGFCYGVFYRYRRVEFSADSSSLFSREGIKL
ncbi:MAG: hypothetical protein V4808_06920 [Pseudomonadota bacterium]